MACVLPQPRLPRERKLVGTGGSLLEIVTAISRTACAAAEAKKEPGTGHRSALPRSGILRTRAVGAPVRCCCRRPLRSCASAGGRSCTHGRRSRHRGGCTGCWSSSTRSSENHRAVVEDDRAQGVRPRGARRSPYGPPVELEAVAADRLFPGTSKRSGPVVCASPPGNFVGWDGRDGHSAEIDE